LTADSVAPKIWAKTIRNRIETDPEGFFAWSVAAVLLVKVVLALVVPLTGDEAYFLMWGKNLDFGYYDHPPMVGWVIYLVSLVGDHLFLYRLFPIATSIFVALAIFRLLRGTDRVGASLVALIFLLSPVSILNVIITTDTPLILFVFLSAVCFTRGVKSESRGSFVLAGVFLGLSFLSKYFAVLLLAAFAGVALAGRQKKVLAGIAITALVAFPLVAVNLYWNYSNCWTNVLFNLLARTRSSSLEISRIPAFLAMQLYILMPWTLYHLWKGRKNFSGRGGVMMRTSTFYYIVPFIFFLGLSVKKSIGLHWMASFTPFFFMLLIGLERKRLLAILKYTLVFSALHVAVVVSLLSLPPELFKDHKRYNVIRLHVEPEAVCEEFSRQAGDTILASDSYSIASVLSYHCDEQIVVFGSYSKYGRADDKFTDFRELEGKDITLFSVKRAEDGKYEDFFSDVRAVRTEIDGAPYTLIFGRGFKLANYREGFLEEIRTRYYQIPSYLPCGACYFLDRYFEEGRPQTN
jgi:hypothetical protein